MIISLYLPYPVSMNSLYGKNRHTLYISSKGRQYIEEVQNAILEQLGTFHSINNFITLDMVIQQPSNKRKRDLDNLLKITLDSLTKAGLWEDDYLIQEFHIKWGRIDPKAIRGCMHLTIKEIL